MTNKGLGFLFIVLCLTKTLAIYSTNFNLFGDEAQYWIWSKNLEFGYFSKPPFLSWFIRLHTGIFGEGFLSLKILPSFVYLLTSVTIYDICKSIGLNKNSSLSCSLLFLFIPAVSVSSFIISTDLFLLLFWTLSLNILLKIRKKPNISNFVLLGIMLGLAFLSKYAAIYFIICFLIYFFIDNKIRVIIIENYFKTLVCFVCVFLIILPNIIWNFNNGWVTIQHTSDNANFENLDISLFRGLLFLVTQILMVSPFLFFANIAIFSKIKIDENQKMLLVFSVPIFLIVFIEAVIVRANANWAAPALVSFFIFLYVNIINLKPIYMKLNIVFNFIFCFLLFIIIGFSFNVSFFDRVRGINDYAQAVKSVADKKGITDYVISDRLLYSNFVYELKDYDLNFYMPHKKNSRITNHFKISSPLKRDIERSFVFIGHVEEIDYLENKFTCKEKELDFWDASSENIIPFKFCYN